MNSVQKVYTLLFGFLNSGREVGMRGACGGAVFTRDALGTGQTDESPGRRTQ